MKTGDQFSMTFKDFVNSDFYPLFREAIERGWNGNRFRAAWDAATISARGAGLKGDVPLKVFLEGVLAGEFDEFLFENGQSLN